ncbi:hypothetical protein [Bradyrhizobium sp. WSM1743]|uniref:hypothetical protein n=1 Tax=Bradyrhizobium sp. WSM1743 TaxID=318996 RepID=UPI00047FA97E|nr:hypothetical protein [Bradyrhizobium sp. WSM1743]
MIGIVPRSISTKKQRRNLSENLIPKVKSGTTPISWVFPLCDTPTRIDLATWFVHYLPEEQTNQVVAVRRTGQSTITMDFFRLEDGKFYLETSADQIFRLPPSLAGFLAARPMVGAAPW